MDRPTERQRPPHGHGVDASPKVRPGVPRERRIVDPGAPWERPAQQRNLTALARSGVRSATPVFGTAAPAHGVSGALRRLAYRVPERRASRWALLLGADRVDVLEHRLARATWLLPAVVALAVGFVATSRALRR